MACVLSWPSPLQAQYSLRPEDKTKKKFEFTVAEGQTVNSTVVVRNQSKTAITVNMYAADGAKTDLGALTLVQPYDEQKGIGAWTTLEETTVSLEGDAQETVNFSITVPAGTPPGTYAGGIAAASIGVKRNDGLNTGTGAIASTRMILPIIVAVPGERIVNYSWDGFSYESNDHNILLNLQNGGNTMVEVEGNITLSGFPFFETQTIPVAKITLLQKEKVSIPIKINKKPFIGFFTAKAALTFSETDFINRTTTILATEERTIHYNIIPWLSIAILVFVFVLAGIVWYISKQQWEGYLKRCDDYIVNDNETLVLIAKKYGISWKKLAKMNKLKAPFEVKSGQTLLVPPVPPLNPIS